VSDDVVRHLRSVRDRVDETDVPLPPHYPTCFGCGPDAELGFHLEVRRDGDEVVSTHVFAERHSGAPGIAHGGSVAVVVDDVLGYLLYVVRAPGVTRRLEVDYLKPVLTGVPYEVRGRIDSHDGRKLWVSCSCTGPDGVEAFRAKGLFVVVDVTHFSAALTSGGGQGPVAP
jgi:acyl-coenzyme A thioesterase PaaI-like protein